MRNTDKVKFIGFSNGGTGSIGYKVRFAVDQVRRTKVLQTMGCTDITWFSLPHGMTKAEAVQYLQTTNNVTEQAYQDAMARAATRLIGKVTSNK